ncbi:expressed unknown protein [Seminavis robusta]|uniref:Ionotropic glutamate receptor C-terminal domain-containing protein n=1 Tax=Seminavis robusta TaxID=568900 RepID=A0A9N8ENC9_9STRA|nr:expressed unknown protein [Seminavis robusta]|eukprot:Sro1309_g261530.1 n/a (777) ;mRNA; f:23439-25769
MTIGHYCLIWATCLLSLLRQGHSDDRYYGGRRRPRDPPWTYGKGSTAQWKRHLQSLGSVVFQPQKPLGDDSCPCLTPDQMAHARREVLRNSNNHNTSMSNNNNNNNNNTDDLLYDPYGIGCGAHDETGPFCIDLKDCTRQIPVDPLCDYSWCSRSWCYVNGSNCLVRDTPSSQWPNVSYSYAACGHMAEKSFFDHKELLVNTTLRVAINHNTGGWKGAYHESKQSFSMDASGWSGPIYEFLTTAAARGGFTLNLTQPPPWLLPESQKFFGKSSFDYCVYATALGYLDLCIADYTITLQRSSVTPFFETSVGEIYLVVFSDTERLSFSYLAKRFALVFEPFTAGSWVTIFCIMLPILGLVMFFHEYDNPGSAFPKQYTTQVHDIATGQVVRHETVHMSWTTRIAKTLYMALLSFFAQDYATFVVSVGGKVHLLALLTFLWLVSTVYTANLAAILTMNIQRSHVNSLAQARQAGYRFCATRQVAEVIAPLHNMDPSEIVADPVSLGGDGLPGFQCPNCMSRSRALDFMKSPQQQQFAHTSNTDEHDEQLYCDAAFVSKEDLDAVHNMGKHCNKTYVGQPLAFESNGIPMYSELAAKMTPFLYSLKFDGTLHKIYQNAEPEQECDAVEGAGGDDPSLTVEQLIGIWGLTFAFVVAGLVSKGVIYLDKRRRKQNTGEVVRKEYYFDQWGNIVENPNVADNEDDDDGEDDDGEDDDAKPQKETYASSSDDQQGSTATFMSTTYFATEPEPPVRLVNRRQQKPGGGLGYLREDTASTSDVSI